MNAILIFLGVVMAVSAVPKSITEESSQKVISGIAPDLRPYFLSLHLALGLNERKGGGRSITTDIVPSSMTSEVFQQVNKFVVPANFSSKLVDWVQRTFGLSDADIEKLARFDIDCVLDPYCLDLGDIGGICCPF